VTAPPVASTVVDLEIGGMSCAACAARIERRLNRLDGVEASVDYAGEGARVVLASPDVTTATVVETIGKLGYTARPARPVSPVSSGDGDDGPSDDAELRDLWRRLVVAAALFVPVADLALAMAAVPSLRFPGWPWVLAALAAPVVVWSAWPRGAAPGAASSSRGTTRSRRAAASTPWCSTRPGR